MNRILTADNRDYYFDKQENIRGSVATQHYHNSYELYYMKNGKCSYFIHDRSYDVVSGDVILIPTGIIHRTNYGNKPHSRLLINFGRISFRLKYLKRFCLSDICIVIRICRIR